MRQIALCLWFCIVIFGCSEQTRDIFQGYAEGEFVYIASSIGGTLEHLAVRSGQTVLKGDPLFSLDQTFETAAVQEAGEMLKQAENRLADLQKGLRPSEIESITARLKQAEINLVFTEKEYNRLASLYKYSGISEESLDLARMKHETGKQRIRELESELKTAGMGGREDAVLAAQAEVESVRARMDQARWSLSQKTRTAPVGSLVFDTFFHEGEWVPGGRPVAALLPPENIKVRFFVPEKTAARIAIGEAVIVIIEGGPVDARISYISPQAEYTPPVLYSSQSRAKLVFMVECVPQDPASALRLHPGQPVDVKRKSGDPPRE
jgi:HlyD family secretion protein